MRQRCTWVVLALLPLAARSTRAGEETPAERYAAALRSFAPPTAAAGFVFEGDAVAEESAIGHFRLTAAPDRREGVLGWRLEETVAVRVEGARLETAVAAFVEASLQPVSGTHTESVDGEIDVTYAWERRADETMHVTQGGAGRAALAREARVEAPAWTSLAGLVQLGRLLPPGSATYESLRFDPAWSYLEAGRPFERCSIRVEEGVSWRGRAVRRVTAKIGGPRFVLLLDGVSKDPLVLTSEQPGLALELRARAVGAKDDALPTDVFDVPAATPRACALRVALAFATADATLFAATIHWPSLRENMKDKIKGRVTDDAFRRAILAQFEARKEESQPRGDAEATLREQAASFEIREEEADRATVVMPEAWGRMSLPLRRIEDVWYLVRLPGS